LIVDSGKRRNGQVVWVVVKDNGFTPEQNSAAIRLGSQ
jgi:hypothetical protein